MIELSSITIPSYLHFGYLPRRTHAASDCLDLQDALHLDFATRSETSFSLLVAEGARVLRESFRSFSDTKGGVHVLPLSGGLDSRAILCGLLECFDSSAIQTVTFGTPGTWDFEIGRQVAHAAGVRHESINLLADDWTWETSKLVRTASHLQRPIWVFDAFVNRSIPERFGTECTYWSGFMGDPLCGSHLPEKESLTWEEAKERFARQNRLSRSLELTPPGFAAEDSIPSTSFLPPSVLSYDEQLDFGIRQQCLIKQIVLPTGYEYRTPFIHPDWVAFMLNAPRRYRENQRLYKEILQIAYPTLFSLPTKINRGLPLNASRYRSQLRRVVLMARSIGPKFYPGRFWGIDPRVNYIDFDEGLRELHDLKTVVRENIHDLKRRGIVDWVDMEGLWRSHQRKQGNFADALTLLASLEINLKAQESKEPTRPGYDEG